MEADAPLDFALFQLSPRRQRCELVVSGNGRTEKIASGSVKPFVAHLRAAEEQASAQPPPPAIRLQLERRAPWFSKGTLERFVRFVSTPEVLELANTYDLEMSQLEGARKIYAQGGTGDATSGAAAENVTASAAAAAAADVTKKELLRAIDVRLSALKQDLTTACSRASSAGFNPNSVSELLLFANHFGANRLSEACTKFMSLCQRHPDVIPQNASPPVSSHWKGFDDGNVRDSSSSDMSIDDPQVDLGESNNKSTVGKSDSQIHRLSNSEGPVQVASEPTAEQHPKPTIQQAADQQETDASTAPSVGVSRRLSVKDRISMFESQKKEQTPSSGNSTSAGAGRVVPGKGEHRRVPSGASMEKLVRRWSSVSDMSIDLSNNDSGNLNDKKENGTPVATPTSRDLEANSKARADEDSNGLKVSVTSQSWPCQKDNISMDSITKNSCPAPNLSNMPAPHNENIYHAEDDMVINSSIESESSFGKEPGVIQGHTRMSNNAASNVSSRNCLKTSAKPVEETLLKDKDILTSPLSEEHFRMIDKEIEGAAHEVPVASEQIPQNDNRGPHLHTKDIHTEAEEVIRRKDRPSRAFEKVSVGVKSKASSNSRANVRGSSGRDEVASTETEFHDVGLQRNQRNRVARKAEDVVRKVTAGSDSDCSGRQGTNLSRQSSITEQELNLQARVRPGKGNQDRHGELQMKANELEKLYAAHKLTSSRRVKPTDVQVDSTPMVSEVKPIAVLPETIFTKQVVEESITTNEFDANELLKMVNSQGYNISTPQKLGVLSLEESRGKFYEQYMQKRDAKLKEDWKLQREEKEAMLKAMHESLERSKAEMLAKFSRSANIPDSTYVSHSQKIPPLHSTRKNKDQGVDSFLVEEELNSDYLSGDGSSRSADSRKHFSNKVASSQKTSVAPIHKRSSRTVSSGYANRRNPPENPLAQSVPNSSDLRKENTRPSPELSRAIARVQQKSFARSKSIIEESKSALKEDKSRRSQSMRKSQIPDELKDIPSVNEDVYNWAPSRISNNHSEGAFAYNTRRTAPPKAFLRKGNGTHPVVGIAGFQAAAAMMANALHQHNESSGDFEDQQEDSPDDGKEEEEYESIEENLRVSDFPADSDSENPRASHEFGNSDDPGSENGDVNFPSEASGLGGTKFTAFTGNVHNPTGDLPAPWSSRLPQLFPYANDNSDGDAFADSPSGSPSPWNSHSLDEITDADVSRMRKKWGSAQMPFAGVNASQQPRKDVSKGLKKLWKFGRKNRGGDGLVNDWVSASTASECDDDMEDGRDLVVGSSDDFRKSRMGYLASYDGFVENEVYAEQEQSLRSSIPNPPTNFRLREDQLTGSSLKAPRSFFSLPTFRNKGGDARLR